MRFFEHACDRNVEYETRTITWTKNGITTTANVRLTHKRSVKTETMLNETWESASSTLANPIVMRQTATITLGAGVTAVQYSYVSDETILSYSAEEMAPGRYRLTMTRTYTETTAKKG